MTRLLAGGEPFLLSSGRIGCLLIHGFTGTPAEMRPLGIHLNEQGFTALGIRLFGHATRPADMIRARRGDWLADVEAGLDMLRGACDKVAAIGLSMGGLLALWAGSQAAVEAVVCLSTPLAMPHSGQLRFARALSRLVPYVSKGIPDWHDPEAAAGHVTYPVYPTRAAAELRDLIRDVRQTLPKVQVPLLVVQARGDRAVPPDSMAIILENVASADKQSLWLEDSGHVITRDRQRETVFATASAFLAHSMGAPR
jgi:carboxylesterase